MVVRRRPLAVGILLPPVVEELHRTAEKGGYGVVQPARPYWDRDLVGTGMTKLAPTLLPSQWPEAPKKILLVGRNTEEAWAVASDLLALRPETQEVAAIVNLGQPGVEPSIDGLLKLAGWSRADLALAGASVGDGRKPIKAIIIKESVQPTLRQRPPMSVRGGPGDKLEVAMDLRPEQVRSVVRL